MMKPYPDYHCLYRVYSLVAQREGMDYEDVAMSLPITSVKNLASTVRIV